MAGITNLPDKVLADIFRWLEVEDLVLNVRNVCWRWRRLLEEPLVWETLCFRFRTNDEPIGDAKLLEVLSLAPALRAVDVITCLTEQDFLEALMRNCPEIRHLAFRTSSENTFGEYLSCGVIERMVRVLQRLETLDIRGFQDVEAYEALCEAPRLTSLIIEADEYEFEGEVLLILATCPHLQHLDIRACPSLEVADTHLQSFTEQTQHNLVSFKMDLGDAEVTDAFYQILPSCSHLQVLELLNCRQLRGPGLRALSTVSGLQVLSLKNFDAADLPSAQDLLEEMFPEGCRLTNLCSLDLSECPVSDKLLELVVLRCPQLQRLWLEGCHRVTDEGFHAVISRLKGLKSLGMKQTNISSGCVREIPESLLGLRLLDLSHCANIRWEVMAYLAERMRFLKVVHNGTLYFYGDRVRPYPIEAE